MENCLAACIGELANGDIPDYLDSCWEILVDGLKNATQGFLRHFRLI